ncbi:PE domain-containing protein [Gordonia pseudamarae]|jgi:hypothetical protein|uniref:PE domain-containing protein n=1 Tax=Gordonia pseudamarae TaxID=2831662 RepID=A0ABX6IK27_9ACTN|nr:MULTISPECIES: PE domain-containing protein [Gordonia]MBD0022775.1 PE domain-containing protein [Gordonia sp. (in: high G+C Gram-positive bacteria)]QHN27374.1 PE domain-containing protein [Gordonia pseudamarae]QHN36258.1 PE domain-containing protein [Gordonia pseudamarae]
MTTHDFWVDAHALRVTAAQFDTYAERICDVARTRGPALTVRPAALDEVSAGVARSAGAGGDRFVSEIDSGAAELRAVAVVLRAHADEVDTADERLATRLRL